MNPYEHIDPADLPELCTMTVAGRSAAAWLASGPPVAEAQGRLVRSLGTPGQGGAFARAVARYLGADLDTVLAVHYPARAALLAASCRARGDDARAERLEAGLVLMSCCTRCGRPISDPLSVLRTVGPDCWRHADPGERAGAPAYQGATP